MYFTSETFPTKMKEEAFHFEVEPF